MNYVIASSYFAKPNSGLSWFYRVWHENTFRHADPKAVFIIGNAGLPEPKRDWIWKKRKQQVQWIQLTGDIGWCDHLLKGEKKVVMPACCAGWLACAWLAYMNECDLLVKEQDCLWFGPVVERLYKELGDKQAIFGESKMQGTASSLALIKWAFIPTFVQDYLWEGAQTHLQRISETCLHRIIERKPEQYTRFKFGFGKDRPMALGDMKDPNNVFYIEKATPTELRLLADYAFLNVKSMPSVEVFSNHA